MIPRIIPCLLLSEGRLVKTTRFSEPRYVGDPINAVRIFNEKQVDELVVLDIGASANASGPAYSAIEEIVTEAFMPVAYGGGINSVDEANRIIQLGVEKVVVNSAAVERPGLVNEIADRLGASTLRGEHRRGSTRQWRLRGRDLRRDAPQWPGGHRVGGRGGGGRSRRDSALLRRP